MQEQCLSSIWIISRWGCWLFAWSCFCPFLSEINPLFKKGLRISGGKSASVIMVNCIMSHARTESLTGIVTVAKEGRALQTSRISPSKEFKILDHIWGLYVRGALITPEMWIIYILFYIFMSYSLPSCLYAILLLTLSPTFCDLIKFFLLFPCCKMNSTAASNQIAPKGTTKFHLNLISYDSAHFSSL